MVECPSGPDVLGGPGNEAGRDCSGRGKFSFLLASMISLFMQHLVQVFAIISKVSVIALAAFLGICANSR